MGEVKADGPQYNEVRVSALASVRNSIQFNILYISVPPGLQMLKIVHIFILKPVSLCIQFALRGNQNNTLFFLLRHGFGGTCFQSLIVHHRAVVPLSLCHLWVRTVIRSLISV